MECVMDHIVLNVRDEEKMMAFYSKVLLMPPERLDEYRAGKIPFPSVRLNPHTIVDLFPEKLWQTGDTKGSGHVNLNHFCIALNREKWEDLARRLEAHGVPIEEGPVSRWGACGNGTSIYFRDPEDNRIEARTYD